MPKHRRKRRDEHHRHHDRHEHGPQRERGVDQRRVLESFIGTLSALMIVVLILAPLVGAQRQRRRF